MKPQYAPRNQVLIIEVCFAVSMASTPADLANAYFLSWFVYVKVLRHWPCCLWVWSVECIHCIEMLLFNTCQLISSSTISSTNSSMLHSHLCNSLDFDKRRKENGQT